LIERRSWDSSAIFGDLSDVLDRLIDETSFHAGGDAWTIIADMKRRDQARKRSQ